MKRSKRFRATSTAVFGMLGVVPALAELTVPGEEIENDDWSITVTPEGYSDVVLDKRPGFIGREYLSGEWAAAVFYVGGANPEEPIWLQKQWAYPCWISNSNFFVEEEISVDEPAENADGFTRYISKVSNNDLEITIRYEMQDTVTGVEQGEERASSGGEGASLTSNRYVFQQVYSVKNVSGEDLSGIRFYQFLHGLESGVSTYDSRDYGGPLGEYRYDNSQTGTSLSVSSISGDVFSHTDTVCMHAADAPSVVECGYYGREGFDSHIDGKPSVGVHLSVEANSLNGVDFFDPRLAEPASDKWVSGAMAFEFPDLANGESHDVTVLFSLTSETEFFSSQPVIKVVDTSYDGSNFILDFEETTNSPVTGYILRATKDLTEPFPGGWSPVDLEPELDVPYPGANRYTIPIYPDEEPNCFFRIQPFFR